MKNILFYYSSQQVHTGSPRVLMRLVEGLDRSCFKPYFLTGNGGELSLELKKRGTKLIRGASGQITKKTIRHNLVNILSLMHLLYKHRIALVHINELGWNSELALAARILRIPVIFHIHNPEKLNRKNLNCRIGAKYLFVSKALAKQCDGEEVLGAKTEIMYNPITVERFAGGRSIRSDLGVPGDVPVVGTVAQISRRKGIDIVIDTAAKVLKTLPETRFLIAGPDAIGEEDYSAQMRARVCALGLENRFQFCGPRDDIDNFLASIDLFFLPTRAEPFGMVIAEAMAAGVPVVTSNVGGIPELIPDNTYGLVTTLSIDDFAQNILCLMLKSEQRYSIIKNAYERVKNNLSDTVFNERLKQIYNSFI